uniref:DUF5641 domain-containing protein n=1 Tax=Loa loa TaxID=7209 RepID=A0A1I7V5G7_LOALO
MIFGVFPTKRVSNSPLLEMCITLEIKSFKIAARFVQNRVEETRKTKISFRHVPSEHNPKGPQWLKEPETKWSRREDQTMKGYEDETEEGIIAKVTENSSSRVGEIVLLDEHETAQGLWKLAKIKELRKG